MHIALYKPDIPQNTADIIILSDFLNLKFNIFEPCGFSLNDARFKRVVMDYLGVCKIFKYEDYNNFLIKNRKKRIVLMTTKAKKKYYKFKFNKNDILLFGRESAGVPENLHKTINNRLKVPMNKKTRSLNVAMCVAIVSAEALRQNKLLK